MQIIFQRFSEYLTLIIDRKKKTLKMTGEHNNYQTQETPWKMLWDPCERHKKNPNEDRSKCTYCNNVGTKQDKATETLEDKDFVDVFVNQMKLYGFRLIKWE